jgi:hypothetical protein
MFIKIFNKKMNLAESNYVGSRIKGNTENMISKNFTGDYYNRQVKYSEKMITGVSTCVSLTEAQFKFLSKDVEFQNIIERCDAAVIEKEEESQSSPSLLKSLLESAKIFVCSDNMGNKLFVGDMPVVSFEEKLGGTKRREIVRKTNKGMYFDDNNYLSFEHIHRICA